MASACGFQGVSITAPDTEFIGNTIRVGGAIYGGLDIQASRVVVTGNHISGANHAGIEVFPAATYVTITGNVLYQNGLSGAAVNRAGIYLEGDDVVVSGNIITGTASDPGINITSNASRALIVGNNVRGNGSAITNNGVNSTIRNNEGYATENSGTATISSGSTSTDVTHGLAVQPATSTISIIPLNNLGNASSTSYWVSDVGASTFRINVGVDPGASGADFSWQIGSY